VQEPFCILVLPWQSSSQKQFNCFVVVMQCEQAIHLTDTAVFLLGQKLCKYIIQILFVSMCKGYIDGNIGHLH